MRKLIYTLCVCVLAFSGLAQSTSQCSFGVFKKEYKHLLGLQPNKNYQVGITCTYYLDKSEKLPMKTEKTFLKVFDDNQYVYKTGEQLQIQEKSCRIDIDTTTKRLVISKPNSMDKLTMDQTSIDKMDSTNYVVTKLVSKTKIVYEVVELVQKSQYKVIRFSFDAVNQRFLEMEMLMWPSNFVKQNLDDVSEESPRTIFTYTTFESIDKKSLSQEELIRNWVVEENSGVFTPKNLDYKIYDLR